jgi:hypothetical protein
MDRRLQNADYMGYPLRFPRVGRRFWQACASGWLLLGFVWYAMAPLPLVALSFAFPAKHAAHELAAVDGRAHDDGLARHGFEASDIPGSPLHPDDHDCFDCQILKYLARCILSDAVAPTLPVLDAAAASPSPITPSRSAGCLVPIPPIRAPPIATVS